MANTIKVSKKGPTSVPAPERFRFQHGQYPPSPMMQPAPRIKPMTGQTQYGKQPPLDGDTGMGGMS